MELSAGLYLGSVTAAVPFAPYSSRHRGVASVRKASRWRGRPRGKALCTGSTVSRIAGAVFATVDHEKNKAKPPAVQHQYSTFHLAAEDPMSPGPASVRHDSNPQFLSQKGRRYRPLFMIRALFFAGNLINSYINSSLLQGAL